MNSVELRLESLAVAIRQNAEDDAQSKRVLDGILELNFGKLKASDCWLYSVSLSPSDRMLFIRHGGFQMFKDDIGTYCANDLNSCRMAGFLVEVEARFGTDYRTWLSETFGSDWETRLKNPRGSSSSSTGKVFGEATKIAAWDDRDLSELSGKSVVMKAVGRAFTSLKPFETAEHPADESGELIHKPGLESVECSIMLKEHYWSLVTSFENRSGSHDAASDNDGGKNAGLGNMASGTESQQYWIIGLVPHTRFKKCGCIGSFATSSGVHSYSDDLGRISYAALQSEEEGNLSKVVVAMHSSALVDYYRENFPGSGKSPFVMACNAIAGVQTSRLNKSGKAPKIFSRSLDIAAQQQQLERYLATKVDDQIRRLLGQKKLNSVEHRVRNAVSTIQAAKEEQIGFVRSMNISPEEVTSGHVRAFNSFGKNEVSEELSSFHADTDMSEWYDEEFDSESGETFYQAACKVLIRNWMAGNKMTERQLIGVVTERKNGGVEVVSKKNIGKMMKGKSTKFRTGDKSTTSNGARCGMLTSSTVFLKGWLNVANPELTGMPEGFQYVGNGWRFSGVVAWKQFYDILTAFQFDWNAYAAEKVAERLAWENASELARDYMPKGFYVGMENPVEQIFKRKDLLERLVTEYMLRINSMSFEELIDCGDSWLQIRQDLLPEIVELEVRSVDSDELNRLQNARTLVEEAGEDVTMLNVYSAFRKPRVWERLRVEHQQTMADKIAAAWNKR